jgi:hypothetical protein
MTMSEEGVIIGLVSGVRFKEHTPEGWISRATTPPGSELYSVDVLSNSILFQAVVAGHIYPPDLGVESCNFWSVYEVKDKEALFYKGIYEIEVWK